MRRRSQWMVAATVAALALGMSISAGNAKARSRLFGPSRSAEIMPAAEMAAAGQAGTSVAQDETGESEKSAVVLDTRTIQTILGKDVRSSTGENMGRLVDVLVDREGQPRAAVIDFGGFLGVGSRKIAVEWGALNFARESAGGVITVQLTRDQVKAAPEFKEGGPVAVLGISASSQAPPAPSPQTDSSAPPEAQKQ